MSIRFRPDSIFSTELRISKFKKFSDLVQDGRRDRNGKYVTTLKEERYNGKDRIEQIVKCWMPGYDFLSVQALMGTVLVKGKQDVDFLRTALNDELNGVFERLVSKVKIPSKLQNLEVNGMKFGFSDTGMVLWLGNSFNVASASKTDSSTHWMLDHSDNGFITMYQIPLNSETWKAGLKDLVMNAAKQIETYIDQYHVMLSGLKFQPLCKYILAANNNPYYQSVIMLLSIFVACQAKEAIPTSLLALFSVGQYASLLESALAIVSNGVFTGNTTNKIRQSIIIDEWVLKINSGSYQKRSLKGCSPYGITISYPIDRLLFGFIKTRGNLQRAKSFISANSLFDADLKEQSTSETKSIILELPKEINNNNKKKQKEMKTIELKREQEIDESNQRRSTEFKTDVIISQSSDEDDNLDLNGV